MTTKPHEPDASVEQDLGSESETVRFKALVKASALAIVADLMLIGLKYGLAMLTGSPVIFADALHSGGDLAVSLVVLLSILVHYRFKDSAWAKNAEAVVALLIACILIIGSVRVILGAIGNEQARFRLVCGIPLVIAIAGMSIALGLTFAMFRFKRQIGEQYASIAFIAEGMHTRSDFFTSVGVWGTLLLAYFTIHIERVTTLLVGLAVFHIGIHLFFRALSAFGFILEFTSAGIKVKLNVMRQIVARGIANMTGVLNYVITALTICSPLIATRFNPQS
jgi:membrane protease subunit HflK